MRLPGPERPRPPERARHWLRSAGRRCRPRCRCRDWCRRPRSSSWRCRRRTGPPTTRCRAACSTTYDAARLKAARKISGTALTATRTPSTAARMPLIMALPATRTPSTTASQAAVNQGEIASTAGLRTLQSPSRTVCQTASATSPKPTVTAEVSLISRAHAGDRETARRDGGRQQRDPRHHAGDHPGGVAQRGLHAALAGAVDLLDLRALLDEHHHRVHARGQRDEDVIQLEHQHPALERRVPRRVAHLRERGAPALERGDALPAPPGARG